uniref:uncharacterized protein n=1 Tax=Myxine glutinosa TaxID=7769 RepID=UPI00358ED1CC
MHRRESRPQRPPKKKKKPTLWNRLKQMFGGDNNKERCADVSHSVKSKMFPSSIKDADLNCSPPQTPPKKKKRTLWKRVKHMFGGDKNKDRYKKQQRAGDLDHSSKQKTKTVKIQDHDLIGDWMVISKIGQGGLGKVYKAKNIKSAVEVALKKAIYVEENADVSLCECGDNCVLTAEPTVQCTSNCLDGTFVCAGSLSICP